MIIIAHVIYISTNTIPGCYVVFNVTQDDSSPVKPKGRSLKIQNNRVGGSPNKTIINTLKGKKDVISLEYTFFKMGDSAIEKINIKCPSGLANYTWFYIPVRT